MNPRPSRRRHPPPRASDISPLLLALFSARTLDELIEASFRMLQRVVQCDFASASYRTASAGFMKERDSRGREYSPAFMRRREEITPALPLVMANPGIKVLPTRTGLPGTEEELRKTAHYREVMQVQGWRHAVALCFWGDPREKAPVFVASVFRHEGKQDFSEREIAVLEQIHAFLDCAVNRVRERQTETSIRDGMAAFGRNRSHGTAVLDWNLRLVQANSMARRLCAEWAGQVTTVRLSGRDAWRCPDDLSTVCRELHREWQRELRRNPDAPAVRRRRMEHPTIRGLEATITMMCRNATGIDEPSFVVALDKGRGEQAHVTRDRAAKLLHSMTVAERAVALVLAEGLTNQEIADRVGKSLHAVKFLLHRIYQKTGVPNRAALVAILGSGLDRSTMTRS